MKRLALIGAVTVGFPFVPSGLCGAEESPDRRVSWDVEGYLSGLVDVQPHKVSDFAALRRARWSQAQTVVLKKGNTKKNKELTSCEDLLSVYDAIVDSAPPMRWTDLQLTKVQCGVMDRISRLSPSRTGYLAANAEGLLSGLAKLSLTKRQLKGSQPLSSVADAQSVECNEPRQCLVRTPTNWFSMRTVAAGDANGDGIEDCLLVWSSGPLQGSMSTPHGLIVTRKSKTGELDVLDAW